MASILITGGAGFIGRHLARKLRAAGHRVTVYDNLHPQVHPDPEGAVAELQSLGVTFTSGDVLDGDALAASVIAARPEVTVHLAAETGTGQSYDLPSRYCEVNVTGTARLIEALRQARSGGVPVQRVLLAGSRAVYGEGAARNITGREVTAVPRLDGDLASGDFSPKDAQGRQVEPIPSCASKTVPAPASVYASTKLMQEYLLQQGLESSGVEVGILRLQNVYGAGQSLHNPYTGVLSIFVQQLLDGKDLEIYEDGMIVRDFVYVSDVADAFCRLCEIEHVPSGVLDIGSGAGSSILDVARTMTDKLGLGGERFEVTGRFRPGDIRHAVADVAAAEAALGWAPQIELDDGIAALVKWARGMR